MAKSKKQDAAGTSLPKLDENVLSALTKKIDSKLHAPKDLGSQQDAFSKTAISRSSNSKKTTTTSENKRGKKRAHSGEVVQGDSSSQKSKGNSSTKDDLEALRAEIIALGGTEDDLALVAGLESGSEVEDEPAKRQTGRKSTDKEEDLRDDVAKMLKGMGVESSRVTATTAESDEDMESEYETDPTDDDEGVNDAPAKSVEQKESAFAQGSSKLTVSPQADWFSIPLPDIPASSSKRNKIQNNVVEQLHQYGKELLDAENAAYQANQKSKSSSQRFYATVINSGTLTDKISALTLGVQESPIHNVKGLETLLGLARKRSRAQAIDVLRALKDLFAQGSLLPSDRRLRTFATQPGLLSALSGVSNWSADQSLPKGLRPQHLIVWAYEHWLKDVYFEVLTILESWCNDELEFSKARAISYVFELLKEKPEQESNLLRLLVNKLGDRTKKIASRSSYLLLQLQLTHPLMKSTIISAIETELLWKPGQSLHAKYYAVITLNQTILSSKEEDVATRLLETYFGLFVTLLKPIEQTKSHATEQGASKKSRKQPSKPQGGKISLPDDELREKLTSAILTGINRAYPYVTAEREKVSKHMDTLFRITHSSNFNTSIQAMLLIQQLTLSNQLSSDRFYRTLYESLLDPRLVTSSKQSLYLNLLFRSLKADLNVKRVKAFVKRILQITVLHQPSFVLGVFHLLKELEVTFPSLKGLVDQAEEHDQEEEHFRDVDEEENSIVVEGNEEQNRESYYDGKKRDPEHSNADRSCLWELLPYLVHYHPSVVVGAESMLHHTALSGKPDLNLYTLIHFLDRFVYRNAKASASSSLRGASVMQPTLAADSSMSLFSTTPANHQLPVNKEAFWQKKAENVAPEDVFFHQYFRTIGKDKLSKKKSKAAAHEEGEEDEEDAIWKAITESRPEVEGDDESDDDLDMDDLESDFEDSDGELLDEMDDSDDNLSEPDMSDQDGSAVEFVGFNEEETDEEGLEAASQSESTSPEKPGKKAKHGETARDRKRKFKAMPTFASADDYAAMLDDERGEDLG